MIDQSAIVTRVRSGAHCAIRWVPVRVGRLVVNVGEDVLQLDGIRQCVTAETAQRLADSLGCILPTPEIVDAIHAAAVVRCRPCIQTPGPSMASLEAMDRHSRDVGAQIHGPGLASTLGKDWVLSPQLTPTVAANYGWHDSRAPGGKLWQTIGHRHNARHVDYSQTFRPVSRACLLDGAPADLADVMRSRGLPARQPGVAELAAVTKAPGPVGAVAAPAMPFVQARNYTPSAGRKVDLVVLHSMESAEKPDTAEGVAAWFAGPKSPEASAHYCVDADSVVQCVLERDVAWAAPGSNHNGVHIEMAGRAAQTAAEWADTYSAAVVARAARLVREVCLRHGVPFEALTHDALLVGRRGITTHASVSKAFRRSTHWDPGPSFPLARLVELARAG